VLSLVTAIVVAHGAAAAPACSRVPQLPSYFPSSEFTGPSDDRFFIRDFACSLYTFREPVLLNHKPLGYAVRVTWLTPFFGDAVLRIEDDGGGEIHFVFKRKPTVAASDAKSSFTRRGRLSREDFSKLTAAIEQENFFPISNQQNVAASDGTVWLLEVRDAKRYHAAYRIGPFSTPVQDIGRLAAKLAGVDVRSLE
jgi:hypothetical protein